ncbi:MAG: PIG-L deacetylase family protein [Blastococcus sp.]
MSRPHPTPAGPSVAPGTPEAAWRTWLPAQPWPELPLELAGRTVLVCAAHPDDDVLGIGGLMSALAASGTRLHLLAATDGEASHPASSVLTPGELARTRVAETGAALAALGVRPAESIRLRLPDSGLAGEEAALTVAVTEAARGADLVLAPWAHDAHPDHEALGRAALAAGATHGTTVLAFPVWTWQWAVPGDPRVPWERALRVPLSEGRRAAKRAAVDCFATQVRPLGPAPEDAVVLPPEMLASFDRDVEVVFR